MRHRRGGDVHGAPCVASHKEGLRVTGGRGKARGDHGKGKDDGGKFISPGGSPSGREHVARHRSDAAWADIGTRGKSGPRVMRWLDPRFCALQRHALASPQRLASDFRTSKRSAAHCASDFPLAPDHPARPVSSSDSRRAFVLAFARTGSHPIAQVLPPRAVQSQTYFV